MIENGKEEPWILNEVIHESIEVLILNRPQSLNILNKEMLFHLSAEIFAIEENASIKVLIITGQGKAFVAGADLALLKEMNCFEAKAFAELGNRIFRQVEQLKKPVIAAINGYALGAGLELALACDLRVASGKAKLGLPEVNLGIIPGWGGTQRLPRLIGMARAKEMIFTGKIISAEEAEKIGLVNKLVSPEEVLPFAIELAQEMAGKSSLALMQAKSCINSGFVLPLEEGLSLENNAFGLCFSTEDHWEGMEAFLTKREAQFKNR
jgi:enoyl-CoA hydratase